MKALKEDRVHPLLQDNEDLALAGVVSKEAIDFLTRQIRKIERVVEGRIELSASYGYLLTIPGVGKILALTIMLETGPVSRFAKVGNYVSYCRKVSSHWSSNGKLKGGGNKKNGNRYLAWAFSEAVRAAKAVLSGTEGLLPTQHAEDKLHGSSQCPSSQTGEGRLLSDERSSAFRPEKLFS